MSKKEMISAIRNWLKNDDIRTVRLVYYFMIGLRRSMKQETE